MSMIDNRPVMGCPGCSTSAGAMGCQVHNPYRYPVNQGSGRVVTTRQYRIECPSCQGSGQSKRPLEGTTQTHPCAGCEGKGTTWVTETTTTS